MRTFIIRKGDDSVNLPLHIPRLIKIAKEKFDVKARGKSDLAPGYVFDQIQDLLNSESPNGIKVFQQPRLEASQLFREAN